MTTSQWGTRWGSQQYYDVHNSDGTPALVTGGMAQALERLRVNCGETEPITMYQGCRHTGVAQSAETHWGADVVDISDHNYVRRAEEGSKIGLVLFHREYNWDGKGGMAHIHMLLRPPPTEVQKSLAGDGYLNYQAAQQILAWDLHQDGLVGEARYDGPWYPVKSFIWHPDYQAPTPPVGQPSKHPLADHWQTTTGAGERALDAAIAAGEAFAAAHPNLPAAQTAVTQMKTARTLFPTWWATAHAHNPTS